VFSFSPLSLENNKFLIDRLPNEPLIASPKNQVNYKILFEQALAIAANHRKRIQAALDEGKDIPDLQSIFQKTRRLFWTLLYYHGLTGKLQKTDSGAIVWRVEGLHKFKKKYPKTTAFLKKNSRQEEGIDILGSRGKRYRFEGKYSKSIKVFEKVQKIIEVEWGGKNTADISDKERFMLMGLLDYARNVAANAMNSLYVLQHNDPNIFVSSKNQGDAKEQRRRQESWSKDDDIQSILHQQVSMENISALNQVIKHCTLLYDQLFLRIPQTVSCPEAPDILHQMPKIMKGILKAMKKKKLLNGHTEEFRAKTVRSLRDADHPLENLLSGFLRLEDSLESRKYPDAIVSLAYGGITVGHHHESVALLAQQQDSDIVLPKDVVTVSFSKYSMNGGGIHPKIIQHLCDTEVITIALVDDNAASTDSIYQIKKELEDAGFEVIQMGTVEILPTEGVPREKYKTLLGMATAAPTKRDKKKGGRRRFKNGEEAAKFSEKQEKREMKNAYKKRKRHRKDIRERAMNILRIELIEVLGSYEKVA